MTLIRERCRGVGSGVGALLPISSFCWCNKNLFFYSKERERGEGMLFWTFKFDRSIEQRRKSFRILARQQPPIFTKNNEWRSVMPSRPTTRPQAMERNDRDQICLLMDDERFVESLRSCDLSLVRLAEFWPVEVRKRTWYFSFSHPVRSSVLSHRWFPIYFFT